MEAGLEMAKSFYGYGRWDAPYWFLGPEEGKGSGEVAENTKRIHAWASLGKLDLLDCKEFHQEIGDENWHKEKAPLQRTWRPLMLLMMTYLSRNSDNESLRSYQRLKWGRRNSLGTSLGGETCLIELSGCAAKNLGAKMDHHLFKAQRMAFIKNKLAENKPKLIVMYGSTRKMEWETIAGRKLNVDEPLKIGTTLFASTPHPNAHGRTNSDWIALAKRLQSAH